MAQAIKNWWIWLILLLLLIIGVSIYFFSRSEESQPYEGTELSGIAPDFRLMDQHSNLISLSNFRGRIVVLTFMDSQCKDICPLTSAQLLQAYKRLNPSEVNRVVFLAVNVNAQANTEADVLLATQKWRLGEILSWHFLTGDSEDLESVWKDYGVAAETDVESGEIMHTPGVFLIDPAMQKRWYISTPYSTEGNAGPALPLSELLVDHIREILRDK